VENILPGITKRVKKGTMVTLSYYDERPDRESQLANTNCTQWPGAQPVWDKHTDKPACGCTGDMVWNQDRTKCISRIEEALANANCGYPNSYPVWNYNLNQAMCECLPGTAWNNDKSACINSKQAALERMDCSQYPGTIPGYDNSGNPMCVCPDGLPWIQGLNRCANQQDVAMASTICSQYPGTVPGWDAQNNREVCNCPSGTEWSQGLGKCISEQELAMANTDCSHLPGSSPAWSYITNQAECKCQPPYSQDLMTGKCVDFAAQLLQRERDSREQSAQSQRDFEERMANKRKQDQKKWQQLWDDIQPIVVQPKSTNNGPLCKGHHLVCGYGYNEYKHAVKDYNQDETCDICGRPYTAKQGYRVLAQKRNPPCVKYYSKLDGPICQGHTLDCDQGYNRGWKRAIDSNPRDRICDICGRSFKKSGNKVRAVITKKNVKCKKVTK
jgi:hypothetical protein